MDTAIPRNDYLSKKERIKSKRRKRRQSSLKSKSGNALDLSKTWRGIKVLRERTKMLFRFLRTKKLLKCWLHRRKGNPLVHMTFQISIVYDCVSAVVFSHYLGTTLHLLALQKKSSLCIMSYNTGKYYFMAERELSTSLTCQALVC